MNDSTTPPSNVSGARSSDTGLDDIGNISATFDMVVGAIFLAIKFKFVLQKDVAMASTGCTALRNYFSDLIHPAPNFVWAAHGNPKC
jgi:hypothetical protein